MKKVSIGIAAVVAVIAIGSSFTTSAQRGAGYWTIQTNPGIQVSLATAAAECPGEFFLCATQYHNNGTATGATLLKDNQ